MLFLLILLMTVSSMCLEMLIEAQVLGGDVEREVADVGGFETSDVVARDVGQV